MSTSNGIQDNARQAIPSYLDRKKEFVIKDFETAVSAHHHYANQIVNLRNWNITLLGAYVGFLFTQKITDNSIVVPVILISIPFVFLELWQRAHLIFLEGIIHEIEDLFMLEDDAEFARRMKAHIFKDLRLAPRQGARRAALMVRNSLTSVKDFGFAYWFLALATATLIIYFHFRV